ncbi:hypothetical protein [Citricoccus muralis]|uniref:hypothetical protein n=1 Tax=Citricoccus muralis TaxID=169134 RepID=UPI0011C05F7A|nr:hypothetical protein [Citricoccus muralis]
MKGPLRRHRRATSVTTSTAVVMVAVAITTTVAMAGCMVAPPPAGGPSSGPTATASREPLEPTPATSGPCHRLSAGEVRFDTGEAQRVVFALGHQRETTEATLTSCLRLQDGYAEEWVQPARIGSGGFGPVDTTEVDTLQTPTGSYTMTEGFGRENPGTELEYHELSPDSHWGGRPGPHFNQYFEGDGQWPDEGLWELMEEGLYEQAVVVNFNRPPDTEAIPGLSFAIFLHAGMAESWGCVSTDTDTVVRVLHNAVPGDRFVLGAEGDVFTGGSATTEGPADDPAESGTGVRNQ